LLGKFVAVATNTFFSYRTPEDVPTAFHFTGVYAIIFMNCHLPKICLTNCENKEETFCREAWRLLCNSDVLVLRNQ